MNIIYSNCPELYIRNAYNNIYETLQKDKFKHIYIIVSEQRKVYFENELFKRLNLKSFVNLEVLSLDRFLYQISNEIGTLEVDEDIPSKVADSIKEILNLYIAKKELEKEDLSKFDREYLAEIDNLLVLKSELDNFIRSDIGSEYLDSLLADLEQDDACLDIINRIRLLIKFNDKYKDELNKDGVYDRSRRTALLLSLLESIFDNFKKVNCNSDELDFPYSRLKHLFESHIYFLGMAENRFVRDDEFQLMTLIDNISEKCFVSAEISNKCLDYVIKSRTWNKRSFFAPAEKLICNFLEVEDLETNFIYANSDDKYKIDPVVYLAKKWHLLNSSEEDNDDELDNVHSLKENLKQYYKSGENRIIDRISILNASSIEDLAGYIAAYIKKLKRLGGVNYSDIAITYAEENESYLNILFSRLREYEIPFYSDKDIDLSLSCFSNFFTELLAFLEYNSYPVKLDQITKIFKFLPNSRLKLIIDYFENFVLSFNTNISQILNKYDDIKMDIYRNLFSCSGSETNVPMSELFTGLDLYIQKNSNFLSKFTNEKIKFISFIYVMDRFVKPLFELNINIKEKRLDCISLILGFMEKIDIESLILQELKNETIDSFSKDALKDSWNFFLEFMMEIKDKFIIQSYTIYELKRLYELNAQDIKVKRLPIGVNQIFVSRAEKVSQSSFPYFFIFQAEQASFPFSEFKQRRYFKLSDYKYLPDDKFLYPILENRIAEALIVYNLLLAADKYLCITYAGDKDKQSNFCAFVDNNLSDFDTDKSYIFNLNNKINEADNLINISTRRQIDNFIFETDLEYIKSLTKASNSADILRYSIKNDKRLITDDSFIDAGKKREKSFVLGNEYEEIRQTLFPDERIYSVSQLEKYSLCPMQYFFTYGLSLKERENAGIDARIQGTITHMFLENVFRNINASIYQESLYKSKVDGLEKYINSSNVDLVDDKSNIDPEYKKDYAIIKNHLKMEMLNYLKKINNEKILDEMLNKVIHDLDLIFLIENKNYNGTYYAIKRIISQSINSFIFDIENNIDEIIFRPQFFEWNFGDFADVDKSEIIDMGRGRSLELENEKIKVRLRGKVDRVDRVIRSVSSPLEEYRIVDYKLGRKEIEFSRILDGIDMQLLVYIEALQRFLSEGKSKRTETNSFFTDEGKVQKIVSDASYFLLDAVGYRLDHDDRENLREIKEKIKSGEIDETSLRDVLIKIQSKTFQENSLLNKIRACLENKKKFKVINELKDRLNYDAPADNNTYKEARKILLKMKEHVLNKCLSNADSIQSGDFKTSPYYDKELSACKYCLFRNSCRSCDEVNHNEIDEG